jgi:hypothetical protein
MLDSFFAWIGVEKSLVLFSQSFSIHLPDYLAKYVSTVANPTITDIYVLAGIEVGVPFVVTQKKWKVFGQNAFPRHLHKLQRSIVQITNQFTGYFGVRHRKYYTRPHQQMPSPENLILQYFVLGLRLKLNLSETQAFTSILPILDADEFDGDVMVQVSPGAIQPYGPGSGAQDGGAILVRQFITLTVYYRLNLDQPGRSDEILTENNTGFTDFLTNIRNMFKHTFLNGVVFERIRYEGESPTTWFDPDLAIVQRTINYSAAYGQTIGGITLTNADLTAQIGITG